MSMPGSFNTGSNRNDGSGGAGIRRRQLREPSEDEAQLSLTSDGDDEFMLGTSTLPRLMMLGRENCELIMPGFPMSLAESDGTIGQEGDSDEEDDEDYDEQAEFLDADDIEDEIYLDDDDEEGDEGSDPQFEIEIEEEDDGDSDEDTEGVDPELAEAQRMASAAEVANDTNATPRQQRYTLAVDPTTNSIYIVDSEGTHTEIGSTPEATTTTETAADGTTRPRRTLTSDATLAVLRRMLGRSRGMRPMFSQNGDDDEEEDDDDDVYRFGGAGGRRGAASLFPKVTEPVQAGVDLERKGLFGRPGKKYDSYPRRKFSPYSTNLNDTMRTREYRSCARPTDRLSLGDAAIPNSAGTEVAQYDDRVYCGQYSKDGSLFYTCAKDYKIRIYDMTTTSKNKSVLDPEDDDSDPRARRYRMHRMFGHRDKTSLASHKTVQAREHLCQWTITDANLSPDNTKMIWSSISPVVGMTRFKENTNNGNEGDYENLDDGDGQVSLDFGSGAFGRRQHFGIWSVRFSADGREIIAGAGSGAIHVYDLEAKRTILSIRAHTDDVNAVCFADTASSNVLVSGSDDNYLKVWDRRSLGEGGSFTKPSGVLVGHTEGVTFVAPKGDGRFVISNGKDQTCKLWDLRMMYSSDEFSKLDRLDVSVRGFDYRYSLYRKPRYAQHPHDRSVMTYTGHMVMQTLIRCHFSPEATTGQRYIYSGSFDGRIHIWNVDGTIARVLDRSQMIPLLTRGAVSNQIKMNDPSMPDRTPGSYPVAASSPVVRDVSWAPYSPNIMSSAWTESGGSVAMHEWKGHGKRRQGETA